MRTLAVITAVFAMAAPAVASPRLAVAPAHDVATDRSLPMATGGRTVEEAGRTSPSGPYGRKLVYQWPATYFESAFRGEQVDFAFDDDANIFSITVDGEVVGRLERPGDAIYRVSGLASGDHRIRIERLTETQNATGAFEGFAVPNVGNDTSLPLPLPRRSRQIEFVGDSFSAGYGNTSTKRECTDEEVWATTDTQQAFGPLVARRFDADYQVNAYSGGGVVRNYNGVAPRRSVPLLYRSDLLEDETVNAYGNAAWDPGVVVIALGGNDFSTPIHASERWATDADLRADYVASYAAFVQQVRASHPRAHFILMSYGQNQIAAAVAEVVERLGAAGETQVRTFSVGPRFERSGCDWHLSLDDHRRVADSLIAYLEANPDIWAD